MKKSNEPKHHGIPFLPFLGDRIYSGHKTRTCRLGGLEVINESPDDWELIGPADTGFHFGRIGMGSRSVVEIKCKYRVDDLIYPKEKINCKNNWFMKKIDARYWGEIIGVGCGRVKDITDLDAIKEGVEENEIGWRDYRLPEADPCAYTLMAPHRSFGTLLETIIGAEMLGRNPWAFEIEWEPCARPEL